LVAAVSGALVNEPAVACVPAQASLAAQLVAFSVDHVSTVDAPLATVIGVAVMVTVGAGTVGLTDTVADCVTEPPVPVHINV
jgi:hypothetical protein